VTPPRTTSRSSQTRRRREPALSRNAIYLLGLLLIVIAAVALVPAVRRERERLLILRNLIEQAAAPDEAVLVDSLWLDRFLRWKGSAALRKQLIYSNGSQLHEELLAKPQELVVVATESSSLLSGLRSYGFVLTPDATQQHWNASGHVIVLPFGGAVQIYFAVPPSAAQSQSNKQAGTP
jgi:hypothetical protein